MKKVALLSIAGVLSFVLTTAAIYLAMPSLAPELVESTRTRLDSLGLLSHVSDATGAFVESDASMRDVGADTAGAPHKGDEPDSVHTAASPGPTPSINRMLSDSLRHTKQLLAEFQADNAKLAREIAAMKETVDEQVSQQFNTSELGKSLGKVEDKQLTSILAGLDLSVIEMLYAQATARERSRLLQQLPPDRAARFVQMLVNVPVTANEMPAQDPLRDGGEDEPQLSN